VSVTRASRGGGGWWLPAALWIAAFALFAWQDGWRIALTALFPNSRTPVFERASTLELVGQHLGIAGVSIGLVLIVGLPLAVWVTRPAGRAFLPLVANTVSVGQTFPPTAVLFLMLPILGFGAQGAVLALFLYGLLPVVSGTLQGLRTVPADALEAGVGSGMNPTQRLWRLELPLALPALLAGVRTSLILVIATATIAPLVGTGGLGVPIIGGLGNDNLSQVVQGALPVAIIALLTDFTMRRLERSLTPWRA
jgi:osmoprotectant transport system permease protein